MRLRAAAAAAEVEACQGCMASPASLACNVELGPGSLLRVCAWGMGLGRSEITAFQTQLRSLAASCLSRQPFFSLAADLAAEWGCFARAKPAARVRMQKPDHPALAWLRDLCRCRRQGLWMDAAIGDIATDASDEWEGPEASFNARSIARSLWPPQWAVTSAQ